MSDTLRVETTPVFVDASTSGRKRVTNTTGSTVYYGRGQDVSSSNNLGSVAAGASIVIEAGRWFVTSGADAILDIETSEESTSLNVKEDFAARGNGVADDTAAIQSALTGGGTVVVPAGTYLISSKLTISVAGTCLRFEPGASLKKTSAFTDDRGLDVTAADVTIEAAPRQTFLDGNRNVADIENGAKGHGIVWSGARGVIDGGRVKSNYGSGILVTGASGELDCYRVKSDHNGKNSTAAAGDGFITSATGAGAVLRCHGCIAEDNDRSGFFFATGCGDGCYLAGMARRNQLSGAELRSNWGTIHAFTSDQARFYGAAFGVDAASVAAATSWHCGHIEAKNGGAGWTSEFGTVSDNPTGTGVELFGAQDCRFGSIISRKNQGYGLALSKAPVPGGSSRNHFGTVESDNTNSADNDPGVVFTGGANNNTIGTAIVRHHTFAVSFGEDVAGAVDNNVIGLLVADNCTYGVVVGRSDTATVANNRIERIVARECTITPGGAPNADALLYFKTTGTSNNTIGSFEHKTSGAYVKVFTETGGASGNKIESMGGNSTPESAIHAPVGCRFTRYDGGAGTCLYVKETGVSNTGWVGK